MSKYVTHPNGFVIGSDNVFFVCDGDETRSDYRAIVSFTKYSFKQINSINVFIKTPAEQLVWYEEIEEETFKRLFCLMPYPKRWLEQNVGEYKDVWDTYSRIDTFSDRCLFFKRRKDALAFVREMNRILDGMHLK